MTNNTISAATDRPKYRRANVQPREIVQLEEFNARETAPDKTLIRALVQTLRIKSQLDPVLLWHDRRNPDNPRLTLLDGRHRLAAYRSLHKQGKGRSRGVPARIVECDLRAALLMSLSENIKDCLPLSATERTNAAWRLVWHPSIAFSKAEIAKAAGVSTRTIANMRKRLKEMTQDGSEPTGVWWRDRQGKEDFDPSDLAPDEITAKISALAAELQGPLGGWKRERTEVIAGALENVFGHDLRYIFDHLYGEDEFAPDAITTETGADIGGDNEDF